MRELYRLTIFIFCFFLVFQTVIIARAEKKILPIGSKQYIMGPEDVIEVLVWREDDLSKEVTIRPDGKVSLPLIGDIQAAGLTTENLKETITKRLKEFIDNPTVSVIVAQINSMRIFIQGEVMTPGVYQLRNYTTVLQAISLAGGFNEWAKRKEIIIIRDVEGVRWRIPVDYEKIISGKDIDQNIILERGDTIIVP